MNKADLMNNRGFLIHHDYPCGKRFIYLWVVGDVVTNLGKTQTTKTEIYSQDGEKELNMGNVATQKQRIE